MRFVFANIIILFFILNVAYANAGSLSGMILLDVERNGEAWYVYPEDNLRYYLGRPKDAFRIMRELGLGINEYNFQKLAKAGMEVDGDIALARRLSGKIIIQTEKNGEAWYVYPEDLKIYYLGRPRDAFEIMRKLGLGITREDLAYIHKPGLKEQLNIYSNYEHKKITVKDKIYSIDVVEIDMKNPNLRIITDTAPHPPTPLSEPGEGGYGALSLGEFVLENDGFAGINATYFESYNASKMNYYFYPVYNSEEQVLINEDQLKYWTTGPIMAWDENNKFYYFKDSREFVSVKNFEEKNGVKLQAALGNKPRLIENGMNLLLEWDIDEKQRNTKANRNAIAVKDNLVYLVIARNSTVVELADIMQAMKVEYALNLDGGYSSALWYNDEYMVGPGRDIPNAIIFSNK
jgi:exopolysaccharide biosynthesis protein